MLARSIAPPASPHNCHRGRVEDGFEVGSNPFLSPDHVGAHPQQGWNLEGKSRDEHVGAVIDASKATGDPRMLNLAVAIQDPLQATFTSKQGTFFDDHVELNPERSGPDRHGLPCDF